jgi:hypothetical protein
MSMMFDAEAFVRETIEVSAELELRERLPGMRARIAERSSGPVSPNADRLDNRQSTLTSLFGADIGSAIDLQVCR